jgi:quinol monooxygenase YgiN
VSPPRYGTEVAFRLGPGADDEAREFARQLAEAAEGCARHVLFLNDAGEYGALAEWTSHDDAEGFSARPAARAVLARLETRLGRRPSVRVYRMEEGPPAIDEGIPHSM